MASGARGADDLLKELADLGVEGDGDDKADNTRTTSIGGESVDDDVFGDIQKQLAKPAVTSGASRPGTPRLSSSTTSGTNKSPKRGVVADHTPASSGPPSGRTSEDRLRANVPSTERGGKMPTERSYHQASVPEEQNVSSQPQKQTNSSGEGAGAGAAAGGGWWGSMFSAATAAVKQAETLAKDLRSNEDAMKWADQMRGYGANLQSLSTDLRSRALPTFNSIITHIAPPISAHERLQVHVTHDIQNYPSIEPLIYETFSRVMSQVEGGDLLVIQQGSEKRSRSRGSGEYQGYRGGVLGSGTRWTDGPWWRDDTGKRQLGTVAGISEGTRLARVSAESYAREILDARGGLEEAARKATETLSESNPVRNSDIFLAIQPICYSADDTLFTESSQQQRQKPEKDSEAVPAAPVVVDQGEEREDLVVFALYLCDPLHSLSFSTLSQPFPQKWADWLDASSSGPGADGQQGLPDTILEIIQTGGLDPREWVSEWMEQILGLAVGVIAQRYVARRMGVGVGGLGRGKVRVEEAGLGGEAARAI